MAAVRRRSIPLQLVAIGGALCLSFAAGVLPLFQVSPLAIGGAVLGGAVILISLRNPLWMLCTTLFLMLLPQGIIADDIHSALSLIALLLAFISWVLQASFLHQKVVWTVPILFILAYYVWSITTLAWVADLVEARRELIQYALVILWTFLAINQVRTAKALDSLMKTLALSGWVLAIAAVWTLFFGGYEWGERLQIFDMNENYFGVILILSMSGVLWSVLRARTGQNAGRMFLSIVYIGLSLGLIALSGSRGGILSMGVLLSAFWLWKPTRPWGKLGLVLAALMVVSMPFVFSTVVDRFVSDDGTVETGRETLWKAGIALISDRPWTGAGIGNGPFAMPAYIDAVSETDHLWGRQELPAHNPVLEVGADTGVLGIILYVGAFLGAIWLFVSHFHRAYRVHSDELIAYCALVSCMSMGYLLSWIKGGGMDSNIATFLFLALLIIPSRLNSSAQFHQ